jgi:hypothetical protein
MMNRIKSCIPGLLCKILAYNLTVLIHEMHESGISVDFCTPNPQPAPQMGCLPG